MDNTVTTGEEHFTLGPACLVISSTPVTCEGAGSIIKSLGFASVTCTAMPGNKGCACSATVHQTGTIGTISVVPTTSGSQSSSGNVVTVAGDAGDSRYAYCVAGNAMTWTPQTMNPHHLRHHRLREGCGDGYRRHRQRRHDSSAGSSGSAGKGSAGTAHQRHRRPGWRQRYRGHHGLCRLDRNRWSHRRRHGSVRHLQKAAAIRAWPRTAR